MQRTNIYLDERQIALLDLRARQQGVSRAEVIRALVDRALADDAGSAPVRAAIDLSFGALEDVELDLPTRRRDDRAEHLARLWAVR